MEKSRKNKKVMAIVAMVLMVCLILAMGAVTFAKYITSGTTGNQLATAAKWGYVVTVDASNLFATDYSVESGTLATEVTGDGVAINAASVVVAPGSTGSMTINISGSAETLAKLTIATEGEIHEIHFGDYYPVKWTLTEGSTTVGTANSKLADVIASLRATSQYFDAGTNYNKSYTLTWEWAFVGTEADANVKDTIIGYKAMDKNFDDIKNVFVDNKQIIEVCDTEASYAAIVSSLSFKLNVSIEQAQTKAS